MPEKILNLIFKATDKATPVLKDIEGEATGAGGGIMGLVGSLSKIINPATIAISAIGGLGTAVVSSMASWREYAIDVGDFAASIGVTSEEASVLNQIMKDFNITSSTMITAMRTLAKEGIEPNIEGLITARYMLDHAANATDRLALAQKLLGDQGVKQLLPMLDQLTNQELREYIDQMDTGNIITQKQIDLAREQEAALKDLSDTWSSIHNVIGASASHAFTPILQIFSDVLTGTKTVGEALREWAQDRVFETFMDPLAESAARADEALLGYLKHQGLLIENTHQLGGQFDGLVEKELRLLQVEAIYAGDYALATKIGEQINLLETQALQLGYLIDYLDLLDGKTIDYTIMQHMTYAQIGEEGMMQLANVPPLVHGPETNPPGWGPWKLDALGRRYRMNATTGEYEKGYAFGGEFTVPGFGGTDSQPVSFMGTPGEKVKVGAGGDNAILAAEIRRLVNSLPVMLRDAVERAI